MRRTTQSEAVDEEPILVVCALGAELRGFVPRPGVDLLAAGVGPVEAAIATASALGSKRYRAVVNAGVAGAFRGRLGIGDAALVAEERLCDLGLEDGSRIVLPESARLVDRAFSSDELLARLGNVSLPTACGITVTCVTATDVTAERLARKYASDLESMEGFAVLRAAERAGVPAVEVRGISNYVGDRAKSGWDLALGSRACVRALDEVLDALGAP